MRWRVRRALDEGGDIFFGPCPIANGEGAGTLFRPMGTQVT